MKKQANIPVRNAAKESNKYLWEVAELMGLSYSGFLSRIRYEWTPEEQERVIQLIKSHSEEETVNA